MLAPGIDVILEKPEITVDESRIEFGVELID